MPFYPAATVSMQQIPWRRCAPLVGPAFLAFAWLVLAGNVAGQTAASLERRLLADCQDGSLDEFDFLSAALVAGGARHECELDAWRAMHGPLRDDVDLLASEFPPEQRLSVLHSLLHERILTGEYRRTASDVRTALAYGDYNCLSALALYYDACRAAELPVEIRAASGHVFLQPAAANATELARGGRRITEVQLLGRFYYNRGVLALEANNFSRGTALLRTSLVLDPADADARENLLAGLNNWAAAEYRAGNYAAASGLIREGLALDATYEPLVANERLVQQKSARP